QLLKYYINPQFTIKNIVGKKKVIGYMIFILFGIFVFLAGLFLIYSFATLIPYTMIYQSKNSSILEGIIKFLVNGDASFINQEMLDLNYFNEQLMYSLIIE